MILVYDYDSWGMWPAAVRSPRSMHMYLFQENLRDSERAEAVVAYDFARDAYDEIVAESFDDR